MTHTPHELIADFPELADVIQRQKHLDPLFARRLEEYHAINRVIHRAETDVEPMSDMALTELRKKRMHLKDELHHSLQRSAGTVLD